jgi:beta-mannosidase
MSASSPLHLNLHGVWKLRSANGKHKCDFQLPGDVHTALMKAGLIPDPYVGRNEYDVRWVADEDWIATRSFSVSETADAYLDISYLDTVATIAINGKAVEEFENCFRRYRPNVSHLLRKGENKIEIKFHSNTKAGINKQRAQPFYIPYAKQNCPIPDGNMLRKPACDFGWDWNLAIAPLGLYGDIALCYAAKARIEHVTAHQVHHKNGSVTLQVMTEVVATRAGGPIDFAISFNGETIRQTIDIGIGSWKLHESFTISKPKLWWPAGSGIQHLYDLEVICEGHAVSKAAHWPAHD